MQSNFRRQLWTVMLLLAAGCSSGSAGVKLSPEEAASQAMAEYDTNKDGALDEKELSACPALKVALKKIDKNGDGRISADEIAGRLKAFQLEGVFASVRVEIMFDKTPLREARVTLVPEKFMGPTYKSASGVTDHFGAAPLQVEGEFNGLVPMGYYRIEVSKKTENGQEMIPAKYNAKTTLGWEVGPEAEERGSGGTITLTLTSG